MSSAGGGVPTGSAPVVRPPRAGEEPDGGDPAVDSPSPLPAGDPALHSPSPVPAGLDARLRAELGMPFLPTVFTLLADHPTYLRVAAEAFLAHLPGGLDEHAQAVRSIGAAAAASLVSSPWQVGPAAPTIAALTDFYNQANPPSLLFTLFLLRTPTHALRVMEPRLPDPPAATDSEALLADIDVCHGNFKIPGFWRELVAKWPRPAACAWALVRRLPASKDFICAREAVRSHALEKTPGGSVPPPSAMGCSRAEAEEIANLLSFYAVVIPTMVVEIECLRHALALSAPRAGGASVVRDK
ncbi:MAG: hypothetical protein ACTHQQ_13510 [Solirubrobacteraceae bacterium]